jgi:hypothetical protein
MLATLWGLACGSAPDQKEVVGGTFVGYTFSESPVVDASVPTPYGYTIRFKAYDLGEDARFIVYAQQENTGDYYTGVIRLSIQDPDGNAFTFYHSTEGEPIDQPILWKRRTPGMHKVSVKIHHYADRYMEAEFDVPLVREPVSPVLVGGLVVALILGVVVFVVLIRRRHK